MGHEGGGIVQSIGESVTKVGPGDRVVLHWRKGSGGEGPFPRYESSEGISVGGGHITTFADAALISENRLTKIDEDIPFEIACLFGCGISTGYGIVFNELKLSAGAAIAVIGCGGVGLNVVQAAALVGASRIVAVDRNSGPKKELAIQMGASEFIQVDLTDSLSKRLSSSEKDKFDAIVDTTGDTNLMQEAFEALNRNGALMLVGQPKLGNSLTIRSALDLFTGKKILVSEGGGFDPDRDMPKLQELYRKHPEKMHRIITDTFCLEDINEAIAKVETGAGGRILIDMSQSN
jgi:S-(hydroxymethyl)glutathione dehydrogenase/alcohol dehydrogenase